MVILMQENRGFDHYFGALPGVRGFERSRRHHAAQRQLGVRATRTRSGRLLRPFRLDTEDHQRPGDPPGYRHDWNDQHHAWNGGAMDRLDRRQGPRRDGLPHA